MPDGVLSLQSRCSTSRHSTSRRSMSFSRYSQSPSMERGCSHNTQLHCGTQETTVKKGPRTPTVAIGNNSKHFVFEGFCHFITPGDLNGTGKQDQTRLFFFLSYCTTRSSNLPLKSFGFWTLEWMGNSPTRPWVPTPLYHRRRKGGSGCPMSFLLQFLPLRFDNRYRISVPFIHKAQSTLCRDYGPGITSLERDVKSAEVTFAKCPTATKHKNQEETPISFQAMMTSQPCW